MRNTGPRIWIIQRREESGMELLGLGYFNHFLQVGRFQKGQFLKESGRVHLKKFHYLSTQFSYLVSRFDVPLMDAWDTRFSVVTLLCDFSYFDQIEPFCQLDPCPGLPCLLWFAPNTGWKAWGKGGEWGQLGGTAVHCEAWLPAHSWGNSFLSCLASVLLALCCPPGTILRAHSPVAEAF